MNKILSGKNIPTLQDLFLAIVVVFGFWGLISLGFAQDNQKINVVKNIRFAPHPSYTRIIFDMEKNVHYKILPDFKNGIVSIIFDNSTISQVIKNKIISDNRIENINIKELDEGRVRFDIKLIFTKNTFFHLPVKNPPRLIFDIKGKTEKTFKDKELKLAKAIEVKAEKKEKAKEAKETLEKEKAAFMKNMEKLTKESEIIMAKRADDGRNDYLKALKTYQSKEYAEARVELIFFLENHPKSKYEEDILFLIAESEFKILTRDPKKEPNLQPVINSFEVALGMYPESKHRDMALYKMAEVYNKMGLNIEAKAQFEIILEDYPDGRYALKARLRRAQILSSEKDYEFAYKEFLKVAKKEPESIEAKDATFQIANFYFNNQDYERAIKIYENASKKWPSYAQFHPDIIFNIGETYYRLGNMEKAQSQLFALVNLYPSHEKTPKSLNRIGEIYRLAKKNEESAKVFQETVVRKPDSEEAGYGLIRIADLGIVNPSMRFNNLIFDYDSFYNPIETYHNVSTKYPETNLAQMAMLREGIAHAKEKSYTAAINKYKELLSTFPETTIKEDVYALMRESFYALVDAYYNQKGYLPLIATYHQNIQPYLRGIKRPEILFRLGKSYQAIGLYDLALSNYQKVKKYDKKGAFSKLILIKSAEILFRKKNYKKAEKTMREFIKRFSKSKHVKDAMQILSESLYNQGKYAEATTMFTRLLKRFPNIANASRNYYYLADSYYQQKKYKDAIKRYKFSIKKYVPSIEEKKVPEHIADSQFKIGESYYKNKQYSKAIKMYQIAIKKNPDDERVSIARYILAKNYNILNQKEKAKNELKNVQEKPEINILNRVARMELDLIDFEKRYKELLK